MDEKRTAEIISRLKQKYPDAECALRYEGEPWKLLVMAILSAQCTDARVNIVSETLFSHITDVGKMADCDISELESYIKSCGLYKTKAKNIKAACGLLRDKYAGEVPSDMDMLLGLPGVGRKIANLIRGDIFSLPAIVCDTHCIRLAGRLGFCSPDEKNPQKIEKILIKEIPPKEQSDFCHRLVLFGRDVCTARSPSCPACELLDLCGGAGRGDAQTF